VRRPNDPLSALPDLEALLQDPGRFKNRLIWSVVLAPPLYSQRLAQQEARQQKAQLPQSDQETEGDRE